MLTLQKKYSHFQRVGQRKVNEAEHQTFSDVFETVWFKAYVTQTPIRNPEWNQQDEDAKQLVKHIFIDHCFICTDEIIFDNSCGAANDEYQKT